MSEDKVKVLSQKEQRKSLSGSKGGKVNRSVRNVLAKPYDDFWPLAGEEADSRIIVLLETLLPGARKVVSQDDRKRLRQMQGKKMKVERDALTQEIWKRNPGSLELRNCLAIGVNDVSRGLEENELASVLISNEADPPILTRHLSTLAMTRHVPCIVLQSLKICTKKCLDFASLAIGFKKVVAERRENHFHPIHLKIEEVFKIIAKTMAPETPLQHFSAIETEEPAVGEEKRKETCRNPHDIYLTRSSRKYRAFVPGKDLKEKSVSSWAQYISFSSEDKGEHSGPLSKPHQEILGTTSVDNSSSFLQKVRDAKRRLPQASSQKMETESFISFDGNSSSVKAEQEMETSVKKVKTVQRYFTPLASLKVKRIQGNPMKVKKKKRGKNK